MNHFIRVPQIRLIGSDGKMMGLFSTEGAIKIAREEGLDLVEIDPNSNPPVCKIMDYGKFKYLQQKKQHESKKHQTVIHIKEIKMRPNIDKHDVEVKVNHIKRFLGDKDKAKVIIQFRGREMQHMERAHEIMAKIIKDVETLGVVEVPSKVEGRNLTMTLMPK